MSALYFEERKEILVNCPFFSDHLWQKKRYKSYWPINRDCLIIGQVIGNRSNTAPCFQLVFLDEYFKTCIHVWLNARLDGCCKDIVAWRLRVHPWSLDLHRPEHSTSSSRTISPVGPWGQSQFSLLYSLIWQRKIQPASWLHWMWCCQRIPPFKWR